MAPLSLPDIAVTSFTKILKTFDSILTKAEDYAKEKGIDADAAFFEARLIEDQRPLSFQVQNATKNVALTLARLSGVEHVPFEDDEKNLSDLHRRIQRTQEIVKSFDQAKAAAREEELIEITFPNGPTRKFTAYTTLLDLGLPNVYFHLNTGYSILRSKGVPLGKVDYLTHFLFE